MGDRFKINEKICKLNKNEFDFDFIKTKRFSYNLSFFIVTNNSKFSWDEIVTNHLLYFYLSLLSNGFTPGTIFLLIKILRMWCHDH